MVGGASVQAVESAQELRRAILNAITGHAFAWYGIDQLAYRIATHQFDQVRDAIITLCDAGDLLRWRLAGGDAVTLSARAARECQVHLVEESHRDGRGLQEECPRWRPLGEPGHAQRVHQQRPPRLCKRIVELRRKVRLGVATGQEIKRLEELYRKSLRPPRPIEPRWLEGLRPPAEDAAKKLAAGWNGQARLIVRKARPAHAAASPRPPKAAAS